MRISQKQQLLRRLPAVDVLLQLPEAREATVLYGNPAVADTARSVIDNLRQAILRGHTDVEPAGVETLFKDALSGLRYKYFTKVINATGVVLHTNLGRAPLSDGALAAIGGLGAGYTNLEFDLEKGSRGSRHAHGEALLCQLTGAEAALVVNNNAAAVLLVLAALVPGQEVVLSRGEMIEIGGSFRIPEVMAQSGCHLVEVGTTNRTHLRDYEAAVTENTGAILKVHTSNYRVLGFTHEVAARELAQLARSTDVYLIEDLGSGVLVETAAYGLVHEPTVQEAVASGVDVVTFSGDKLLGGPQAGIIVGRKEVVDRCKRHPLARALRVGKLTLAALQATLLAYIKGEERQSVPVWHMMGLTVDDIRERAESVVEKIAANGIDAGVHIQVADGNSAVGGGSLPGETLSTCLIAVESAGKSLQSLADELRDSDVPIVGRIEEDRLLLDLRTVGPEDDDVVAESLARVLKATAKEMSG